jgi:hypothetical protein
MKLNPRIKKLNELINAIFASLVLFNNSYIYLSLVETFCF